MSLDQSLLPWDQRPWAHGSTKVLLCAKTFIKPVSQLLLLWHRRPGSWREREARLVSETFSRSGPILPADPVPTQWAAHLPEPHPAGLALKTPTDAKLHPGLLVAPACAPGTWLTLSSERGPGGLVSLC